MQKYKTLIVEDQKSPRKRLLSILSKYPNRIDFDTLVVAGTFNEAQQIILNGEEFDLSILDKILGGKTCFDLITKENRKLFGIIVLNSGDKESQKHFQEISTAGDFLVIHKPYNKNDIADLFKKLPLTPPRFNKVGYINQTLLIKKNKEEIAIKVEQIVFIEVDDNFCTIFYKDREGDNIVKILHQKQLNYFQSILNPELFQRVHRSYMINLNYFKSIKDGTISLYGTFDNKPINIPCSDNKIDLLPGFIK